MGKDSSALTVVVKDDDLERTVVARSRDVLTGILLSLLILLFLLGRGSLFFRSLISSLPNFRNRRQAFYIVSYITRSIALYLGMVTLINVGLGVVVAGAMYLLARRGCRGLISTGGRHHPYRHPGAYWDRRSEQPSLGEAFGRAESRS
jgi:hypothetical protein